MITASQNGEIKRWKVNKVLEENNENKNQLQEIGRVGFKLIFENITCLERNYFQSNSNNHSSISSIKDDDKKHHVCLFTGSDDGAVRKLHLKSIMLNGDHIKSINTILFDSNGTRIFISGDDGKINIWQKQQSKEQKKQEPKEQGTQFGSKGTRSGDDEKINISQKQESKEQEKQKINKKINDENILDLQESKAHEKEEFQPIKVLDHGFGIKFIRKIHDNYILALEEKGIIKLCILEEKKVFLGFAIGEIQIKNLNCENKENWQSAK